MEKGIWWKASKLKESWNSFKRREWASLIIVIQNKYNNHNFMGMNKLQQFSGGVVGESIFRLFQESLF